MRRCLFIVLLIGLTYSSLIFLHLLCPLFDHLPYLKPMRWALFFWAISAAIAHWAYLRRPLIETIFETPARAAWRRAGFFLLIAYFVLAPLAVFFPSPGHERRDMIFIVLVGPIGEELMFRGVMWDLILKARKGVVPGFESPPALLITSILFGLTHWGYLGFRPSLESFLTVLLTTAMGFTFGKVRKGSGTISLAILAHVLFNALWNLFLRTGILTLLE